MYLLSLDIFVIKFTRIKLNNNKNDKKTDIK